MLLSMTMHFYVSQDSDGSIHVTNMVGAYEGQHHVHTPEDFEKWKAETLKSFAKEEHFHRLESRFDQCDCGLKPGEVKSGR
jgi:hypothetical protein